MARLARGFRTISAACDRFGWPTHIHSEIEGGRRRFDPERLDEFAFAFGVSKEFFLDSGVPLIHDERYAETRDEATLTRFMSLRERQRQAVMVEVPLFRMPSGIVASMRDGRLAVDASGESLALTVGMLETYGCPTRDVVVVRVWHGERSVDYVLGDGSTPGPSGLDLVVLRDGNRIGCIFGKSGTQDPSPDVILRRPIMLTISQHPAPQKA